MIVDNLDKPIPEILAEARAIRQAVQHGLISYGNGKIKTQPLLEQVNKAGRLISRKYKRKYRKIAFSDL